MQLAYGEIREAVSNLERALAADLGGARVSDTYLGTQHAVQAVPTSIWADIDTGLGRVALAQNRTPDARTHFERAHRFWQDFDATHPQAGAAALRYERGMPR